MSVDLPGWLVVAPVAGFSGTVVGVVFVDGAARVDPRNQAALGYFRRHGYHVERHDLVIEATNVVVEETVTTTIEVVDLPEPGPVLVTGDGTVGDLLAGQGHDGHTIDLGPPAPAGGWPGVRASKADLIAYGITQGGDPDDVAAMSKAELVDRYRPAESEG